MKKILIFFGLIFLLNFCSATWWNASYTYQKDIKVTGDHNATATNLTASMTMDTQTLISAGKMQADCDDLQITYLDSNIPREVINCNTTTSIVRFKWQNVINANTDDNTSYDIYYGYSSAPTYVPVLSWIYGGKGFDNFTGTSGDANADIWAFHYHDGTSTLGLVSNQLKALAQTDNATAYTMTTGTGAYANFAVNDVYQFEMDANSVTAVGATAFDIGGITFRNYKDTLTMGRANIWQGATNTGFYAGSTKITTTSPHQKKIRFKFLYVAANKYIINAWGNATQEITNSTQSILDGNIVASCYASTGSSGNPTITICDNYRMWKCLANEPTYTFGTETTQSNCTPTLNQDWTIATAITCTSESVSTGTGKIIIGIGGTLYATDSNIVTKKLIMNTTGKLVFLIRSKILIR